MRMQLFSVLLLLLFGITAKCQIYNKEVIYAYDYSINTGSKVTKGIIYLGCLGKLWPIKEQKQMAVVWTTELTELSQKICNTGVIEDLERIWLHPPRNGDFKILEYSPFPEIRFPVKLNKKWNWQLQLGSFWKNGEYGLTANETIKYTYEIKENLQFRPLFLMNKIDCIKIVGFSTNLNNPTSFSGLFNVNYGFVQMVFNNIDRSIIILELIRIDKWEKVEFKGNSEFHRQIYPK